MSLLHRILREFPFVQHELAQRPDLSCELVARPMAGERPDPEAVAGALRAVLGEVPIGVRFDDHLGDRSGGKVVPFRSALRLED